MELIASYLAAAMLGYFAVSSVRYVIELRRLIKEDARWDAQRQLEWEQFEERDSFIKARAKRGESL